ncbi:CopG family transcriptional regulator [Clavibacter michiganensis]|uniref:CopG family transcriptional regulator n=1 Tax=Clavibacter michiganensis TaxID=28447 RepID=UPI000A3AA6CD|nr:CopG family transcriptional regulator [Clavibacter michiganensis]
MDTAASLPDSDSDPFDRVADRFGVTPSKPSCMAGRELADELEGGGRAELTRLADAALADAGAPAGADPFLAESERIARTRTPW